METENSDRLHVTSESIGKRVTLGIKFKGKFMPEVEYYPEGTQDYFSVGPSFEEAGHTIKAFQPNSDSVRRVFILQAFRDDRLVKQEEIQMNYPNLFGIDIADLNDLEEATDKLIDELSREVA